MSFFGIEIDLLDENSNLSAAIVTLVAIIAAPYTGGASLTLIQAGAIYGATLGVGVLTKALMPQPELRGGDQGYQITQRGSTLPHQIIYGKTRIAGGIVFQGTTDNNKYLHTVLAFAGHEVEEFETIYLNDEVLTLSGNDVTAPAKYVGKVKIVKKLGTTTQTAVTTSDLTTTTTVTEQAGLFVVGETYTIVSSSNTDFTAIGATNNNVGTSFVSTGVGSGTGTASRQITDTISTPEKWTTDCKLLATAYLYVTLKYNADAFPNGFPEVTAVVKGKKVYDPRTRTTAWSDNPALCLRDYITSGKGGDNTTIYNYGISEDIENVDDDLVTIAANVCDYLDYPTLSGDTRFSLNGAFTTNTTPYDAIQNLSTAMGGLLWYAQGKWRMKPAYYTDPVLDLNEDDLRSGISVGTRHSRRDNFNVVKGTFRGPESNYQTSDFPQVPTLNSATYNTFLAADGGQESVVDLQLPFTDNTTEARRIGLITLERNRQQLSVQATFGLKAFQVQVGDIIRLSNTRFGWTNKEFEVTTWDFGVQADYDILVNMTLREISESVFDEVSDGAVYESDNTTLPSPFDVPDIGLTHSQDYRVINEHLTNVLVLDVTADSPERIDYVEVEYKLSTSSTYTTLATGDLGRFEIIDIEVPDIDPNTGLATSTITYDVRARAINAFGIKGEFETVSPRVDPDFIKPNNVSNLTKELSGGTIFFNWTASDSLDLSFYRLHYQPSTTASSITNGQVLIDKIARPATSITYPALSGTFFLETWDKSGNRADNPVSIVVQPSDLPSLNEIEDTADIYEGVKSNTLGVVTTTNITSSNMLVGKVYLIRFLGNTDWNAVAGTTGITYSVGESIYVKAQSAGTGYGWRKSLRLSSFTSPTTGTYDVEADGYNSVEYIDTGSARTVRVSYEIESERHHSQVQSSTGFTEVYWDDIPQVWSTWPDNWDTWTSEQAAFNDNSVQVQVDASDTTTFSDNWTTATGEAVGRYFRFRLVLENENANVSPQVLSFKGIVEY